MPRPTALNLKSMIRLGSRLLSMVLLASACGDSGAGPEPVPVPDPVLPTVETLEVTPAVADLCMPGKTARLTIVARIRPANQYRMGRARSDTPAALRRSLE